MNIQLNNFVNIDSIFILFSLYIQAGFADHREFLHYYNATCDDNYPNMKYWLQNINNERIKVNIPKEKLIFMLRRCICVEGCGKALDKSIFMKQWNIYKKGLGHVSTPHNSLAVWCWRCLSMAHRACVQYLEEYKILKNDWYQCSQCSSYKHQHPTKKTNLIKFTSNPQFLTYVIIYLFNIQSIFIEYSINLYRLAWNGKMVPDDPNCIRQYEKYHISCNSMTEDDDEEDDDMKSRDKNKNKNKKSMSQ